MGRFKLIETPEKLWNLFEEFKALTKSTPYIIEHPLPKGGVQELRKEKALTFQGFEGYLAEKGIIYDLGDYEKNKNGAYDDYSPIITRIKSVIKADQIPGGMSGIYHPNLTARLNGIKEHQDNSSEDGSMSPKNGNINIEIDGEKLDVKVR